MRDHRYYVYILASRRNGTLYVGVTNDVLRRTSEHKLGVGGAFTRKYGVHRLVWCEPFNDIAVAIAWEKRIKRWRRAWKIALIEKTNPQWLDLAETEVAPLITHPSLVIPAERSESRDLGDYAKPGSCDAAHDPLGPSSARCALRPG